jgi:serine/threonine protein kinase
MEFCELGSIRDMLEVSQQTLTEQEIGTVCAQTLQGLSYMHNMKIVHR